MTYEVETYNGMSIGISVEMIYDKVSSYIHRIHRDNLPELVSPILEVSSHSVTENIEE